MATALVCLQHFPTTPVPFDALQAIILGKLGPQPPAHDKRSLHNRIVDFCINVATVSLAPA